jgi:hypothetical protein
VGLDVLKFEPQELRDELAEAIGIWKRMVWEQELGFAWRDDFPLDLVDVTDPGFDPASYEDRTVTPDTEFELTLPRWQDATRITYGDFVRLARELAGAALAQNRECLTEHRYLLRVSPINDEAISYLWHTLPDPETEAHAEAQREYVERAREEAVLSAKLRGAYAASIDDEQEEWDQNQAAEAWKTASARLREVSERLRTRTQRYCSLVVPLEGQDVACSLTEGFTVFGAAVAASGDYNKDLPPILDDLFVEVRFQRPISRDTLRHVADAYLFELSSTLGLEFEEDPRPTVTDLEWYPEGEPRISDARLRPLLLGKGMPALLGLYNRAVAASDDGTKILYFTKVVEYVSQTVVKQQATEAIRAKLLSARSLNPDAAFVAELQAIIEEQRFFRKDREAVKQAVTTCGEASELSRVAPPFLVKLRNLSPSSRTKGKEEALAQLGYSLYATRNSIAHAKANYEPTGEECPEEQLAAFAECAKLAAQQAVRWYHSRPEDARVV